MSELVLIFMDYLIRKNSLVIINLIKRFLQMQPKFARFARREHVINTKKQISYLQFFFFV